MSTIIAELYDALREAGVSDEKAKAAAAAVIGGETEQRLATKADLAHLEAVTRADLAQLEGRLQVSLAQVEAHILRWVVGTIIAMTAVFGAIVKLL